MSKFYLIPQPPLAKNYTLLVDELTDNEIFGVTFDIDKINYNRVILTESYTIDFELYNAVSAKGSTHVNPVGRYICIWEINKNEQTQRAWFVDHRSDLDFEDVIKLSPYSFHKDIYEKVRYVKKEMMTIFKEEYDRYDLALAD